jgi:hypothetical protein
MPETTETKFALEGFLSLPTVALLGLAFLAFSWWMARRDSRFADRPKLVWVLFALRCVAILVLLWMLAGPTLVTTFRKLRTKSIAILVDKSASMGLVDVTDGSGNVTRWAAAPELGAPALRELDEAAATLRAARRQLEQFGAVPNATKDPDHARDLLARAARGIRTSVTAAGQIDAPDDIKRRVSEATRNLQDKTADILQRKSGEFRSGKTLVSLERERWLPHAITVLSVALTQLEAAATQFATSLEDSKSTGGTGAAGSGAYSAFAQDSKISRAEKIDTFLTVAEQSWLRDIRKKATVTRYEFGDKLIPLGSAPWVGRAPAGTKLPSEGRSPRAAPSAGGASVPASHPLASATDIANALQQIALDATTQPLEAAILITDGGHNSGRDPRELAPSLAGTTLHVVPIGNTKMQRDVILHHTHAPKAVLQNDVVVIDSIITAYDCQKEQLQIELLDNNTVVDRQTVNVTTEVFDTRVQLRWKAALLGKHSLGFRVAPVKEERTDENNAAKADVHVMESKIRVLVADNFPRWETRYLLNLFKRDDRVEFDQLLFEPQPASGHGVRTAFPSTLEEWTRYRVVILGDVLPAQFTPDHQKLLREYITEAGGNLIIVAGRDAMPGAYFQQPIGPLIPVEAGSRALPDNHPFYLHLTDEGSMTLATQISENPGTSERVWREMSERAPIYALSEFSKPKPTTHSLIWASANKNGFDPSHEYTRAFLAWHYVGAGRVVYLAAPVTYQLRYRQGDTFHHRFWGQLLRWAVARDLAEGSQTVRISTDKSRYDQGEPVQVSVRLAQLDGRGVGGAAVHVSALQENKLIQEIPLREDVARPGTYEGMLPQLPNGPVKLQPVGDRIKELLAAENYRRPIETTINIDPSGMLELRHPLCNLPLLREIADASGGMLLPPTGLKAALQQLNLEPEVLENVKKQPLWNRWDLFWLFIACLTLEWAGRKWLGLS